MLHDTVIISAVTKTVSPQKHITLGMKGNYIKLWWPVWASRTKTGSKRARSGGSGLVFKHLGDRDGVDFHKISPGNLADKTFWMSLDERSKHKQQRSGFLVFSHHKGEWTIFMAISRLAQEVFGVSLDERSNWQVDFCLLTTVIAEWTSCGHW